MTLTRYVALVVLATVLASGLVAGRFAVEEIHRQKLRDTWVIFFQDLEHLGLTFLHDLNPARLRLGTPSAVIALSDDHKVAVLAGDLATGVTTVELGLDEKSPLTDSYLTSYGGQSYYVHRLANAAAAAYPAASHTVLGLWKIDLPSLLQESAKLGSSATIYLVNRRGALLFANRPEVTSLNVAQRELVQNFIRLPIWQSQERLTNAAGEVFYGFFQEIPETNVVLFAEVPETAVLAPVHEAAVHFAWIMATIGLGALVLVMIPLRAIARPLGQLSAMIKTVGTGDFNVPKIEGSFGELRLVADSFHQMTGDLKKRDDTIHTLMAEQVTKIRLEGELNLARKIQQNFLAKPSLPKASPVSIGSLYQPASEVAGDWFGYHYDEKAGLAVVAIADVSGHGVGSCLFTAVIAGLFATFVRTHLGKASYPIEEFILGLNQTVGQLGRGDWHATFLVACIDAKAREATLVNAGHCFPLLLTAAKTGREIASKALQMPSSPLGLSGEVSLARFKVKLEPSATILMYTDGLTEGAPAAGKAYGTKRLRSVCNQAMGREVQTVVDDVHTSWTAHLAGESGRDDLCIVAVRCA